MHLKMKMSLQRPRNAKSPYKLPVIVRYRPRSLSLKFNNSISCRKFEYPKSSPVLLSIDLSYRMTFLIVDVVVPAAPSVQLPAICMGNGGVRSQAGHVCTPY